MSKPVDAIALAISSHEGVLTPSAIVRKNSKPGIRKKGSSGNLSQTSSTSSIPDDPNPSSRSSRNDAQDTSSTDAATTIKPPTLMSPTSSSSGLGRKQRSAGKLKLSQPTDDEDSLRSSDPASPRVKVSHQPQDGPVPSPRAGPHYQAALAADPSLTYVPMRVYVVTDVSFVAAQSNSGSSASGTASTRSLEFVALSVGRLWNLTTFLLIAGEKLGLNAQALFLKSRLARVISIHDLREDDELVLCQHVEGPFALLDRTKESSAPFVRLSPRSRLASLPSDAAAPTATASVQAGTKSADSPKSRPPSASLSASDRAIFKPASPEPKDSDFLAKPSSAESLASQGRKKSRPTISANINNDEIGGPSTPKSARKLKPNPSSPSASPSNGTSSSSDSIDPSLSTPTKLRVSGLKSSRKISKGGSFSDSSRPNVPKLRIFEETKEDDSNHVYSTPITGQLPFEGRRLVRRDTESFIGDMKNEEIKVNAIAAIKEHDKSITVAVDHPIVEFSGDTGKARSTYSVEALYLELKRSRSLPDVWLYGGKPRASTKSWSSICDAHLRGGSSTTSNTSTFRDDDGDSSDDDSSMTSSNNDYEDKDWNPLTMSEEDVVKRMRQEERQDVTNLQMDDNEVQAGTLRALTRRLFWEYQNDELIQQFLLTYDLFINHLALLKTLIMLFRVPIADSSAASSVQKLGTPQTARRNIPSRFRPVDAPAASPRASPTPRVNQDNSNAGNLSARSSGTDLSESDSQDHAQPWSLPTTPSSSALALNAGMKTVIQHRILTSIRLWIELRYEVLSLKTNRGFFTLFNEFCEYLSNSPVEKHKVYASTLLHAVKSAKMNRMSFRRNLELSRPPTSRKHGGSNSARGMGPTNTILKITDHTPHDWATYFTLREQSFYGKVRLKEYRLVAFSSKDMSRKAPHLEKLINHLNKISFWVATAIFRCEGFSEPTNRSRAAIIMHFIKVMDELRIMQNYSSMMALWSALSIPPVSRLEKSWVHVSSECNAMMAQVTKLRESNFKLYRDLVDMVEPPYIPIQEVLMKDLTFIEENPTILDNGWINFSKIFMLGKAYSSLKSSQQTLYEFKYPHGIHAFYKIHGVMTLEQLYDYSKVVEPSANDLERMAKAENEKREAERREKKFRELISKYQKKLPSKPDLAQLFTPDTTLDSLVQSPDACAVFFVHLEQICESSSLDYYRVWTNDWKTIPPKLSDKLREVGVRIYDTYLAASSDSAISLNNQSARAAVFRAVKTPATPVTVDIFDQINSEVKARLKPLLLDYKRSLEIH